MRVFRRKGFFWLNKTVSLLPKLKSAMVCCENISVSSAFVTASKKIIEETFKPGAVQKSVN